MDEECAKVPLQRASVLAAPTGAVEATGNRGDEPEANQNY